MNKQIELSENCKIDLEKLIASKLLIQANSGGGKSWLIRRILEQTHGSIQHIVLDPEGEFSTLREKYDYILAGKDGDTPAEPKSAALLAIKLLELKVSAIIDLYELHPQERKRFVKLFLESLVNSPKVLHHSVLVVIDEAHTFVPEKGESEAANAVIGLASLGRKRGFCAILATQRIAKLHKDAAAECNNKLIGRTGLDIDRKRAGEELGFTTKEQMLSLRTLKPGEFYAFGPAISDEVKKITVGNVETSHPTIGSQVLTKIMPPTDRIKRVLGKLADLPQEAKKEAQTIKEFKDEIFQLRRHKCIKVTSQIDIDKAVIMAIKQKDIEFFKERGQWQKQIENWFRILKSIGQASNKALEDYKKIVPNKIHGMPVRIDNKMPPMEIKMVKIPSPPVNTLDGDFTLSTSQQKILDALSFLESVNIDNAPKTQVALFAGVSPTSGGYFNNLGGLRTSGYILYPSSGQIALTEIGRESANPQDIPTTSEELHDQLFRRLSKSQQKILRVLIDRYPSDINKNELAELSEQSQTSGGYFNNLGRLRSLKLIDYPSPGMVVALPILFLN